MKISIVKEAVFYIIFIVSVFHAKAQILINEFLASNVTVNQDPQFGEYADWIELYNAGTSQVNLNGYYLTDNLNLPDKWKITQDTFIPSKGFLIIWTDGQNTALHTSFKISSLGEQIGLFSPSKVLIDSLSFGEQSIDVSFGRSPNGSTGWKYFTLPTPNANNNTTAYKDFVFNVPEYSVKGGLFNDAQTVELSSDQGGTIRYTLDGSDPVYNSNLYTNPIIIDKTTIIRSRIFKAQQVPGPIVTNSYFINEGFESRNLPVVSIATNPANFWDPVKGIYVQNFKPDWEVPVNIELFEDNGSDRAAFNERAGTKVNGLYSWQLPQKMLGIYFDKQYGSSSLNYHLFFEKERSGFKNFALRASGNDWSNTLFRDGMVQGSVNYNMDIDIMAFRASIVYVNGQYMGIHNMREKVDEDYIVGNHNLEKGTIDMVENEDFAESGDLSAYNEFKVLYTKDLSLQSNFDAVAAEMDIENFTDYIITEIYSGNYSIDHNVMAWKPKGTGKWKWILMDLDRGFNSLKSYNISYYLGQVVWPFENLYENEAYKQYFNQRLADHLYTTFNPIRIHKRIDYHQNLLKAEISNHVARWLGTTSSYGNAMPSVDYWYDEVEKLRTYATDRPKQVLTNLETYGFSKAATLTLNVSPAGGGTFLYNGLKIPDTATWNGLYPKNLGIQIKAINKPGYIFKGWKNTVDQTSYLSTNSTYNTSLTGNLTLTAIFEATGQCTLSGYISGNTTLLASCSPYLVQGDITIPENVTLTIEPGVEILMYPASNITINGNIIANGTTDNQITFKINPDYEGHSWGALCFLETSDTSFMDYVTIEDASDGPIPITQVAAISAYKADLVLNHMIIEKIYKNPVAGRYSSISLSNSSLHSEITGDLINVKYGHGKIVNCDFKGNNNPDTDAIDYDNVDDGIIKNCRISEFRGLNCDAIDIGEKAMNIMIDSVSIFNITDKGISVGQQSNVTVRNCSFVNCNLGLGLKDSCHVMINHCSFYNVGTPVACFEKNRGSAGGNGILKNSILSNSYSASFSNDSKSTLQILNCISDNTVLPDNGTNLFGNPMYVNPTDYDFTLQPGSPSRNTADDNGTPGNMGSLFHQYNGNPSLMISKIFYNSLNSPNKTEFIGIYNPGPESVDMSGYSLLKGVSFTFPQAIILDPEKSILVSKDLLGVLDDGYYPTIFQWTGGSLANEGDIIQLADSYGIVADQVIYSPDAPWPDVTNNSEKVLSLISPIYDNHFGENWTTADYETLVTRLSEPVKAVFKIYPNPTTGILTIETTDTLAQRIEVYTISGVLIHSQLYNDNQITTLDLSRYNNQILLVKIGERVEKVIILGH